MGADQEAKEVWEAGGAEGCGTLEENPPGAEGGNAAVDPGVEKEDAVQDAVEDEEMF